MTNLVWEAGSQLASVPGDVWDGLARACTMLIHGIIAIVKWCILI